MSNTVAAVTGVAKGTAAEWAATTAIIPLGVVCWEKDTGKVKIGDGAEIYSQLPYTVDEVLTPDEKSKLTNAGSANGFLVLDANGLIPSTMIPDAFKAQAVFVADIAARDALNPTPAGVVVVMDATDDPTVTLGMAFYVYDADGEAYVKIGEKESIDVDYTSFVKDGDSIDRLADSASHVKMTADERSILTTNRNAANGVMTLNGTGYIRPGQLPFHNTYVANIAERDALTLPAWKMSIVYVTDASADPAVGSGWALYEYHKVGENPGAFSLLTSNKALSQGASIDQLTDGGGFVRMTDDQSTKLGHALVDNETLILTGVDASYFN